MKKTSVRFPEGTEVTPVLKPIDVRKVQPKGRQVTETEAEFVEPRADPITDPKNFPPVRHSNPLSSPDVRDRGRVRDVVRDKVQIPPTPCQVEAHRGIGRTQRPLHEQNDYHGNNRALMVIDCCEKEADNRTCSAYANATAQNGDSKGLEPSARVQVHAVTPTAEQRGVPHSHKT